MEDGDMMKIDKVEAAMYRIPPAVPWEDATHVVSDVEYVVTTVTTDDGLTGIGWSYTSGIGGTAVEALINDYLAHMLTGRDVRNIEGTWEFMMAQVQRCGPGGLNTSAIASIDIALWDIWGKICNQPLYRLLGGAREEIPAYGSGVDYGYSLDELSRVISSYVEEGYDAIKIKIGYDTVDQNVERIRRVRELIGDRMLFVDLNQKWSAAQAIQYCHEFEPFHLGWVEEPISRDDIVGHSKFRDQIKIPLAIGESLYTKSQFADFLRANAVDVVQPDVGHVGGITEWVKIAHLADAFFRPVASHFVLEISVSLLCGVPNGMILENTKGGSLTEVGVLKTPISVKGGKARPPQKPGHGVEFDLTKLERFRVRPAQLRATNLQSHK
jgi:L-alanine-DL-glutamate epimerase-like enolase superfamily enzyme